jgi:hypothetical protein
VDSKLNEALGNTREAYGRVPSFISQRLFEMYSNKKLLGFCPRANYTNRATAPCQRSYCQLLQIEGVAWSAQRIPTAVF